MRINDNQVYVFVKAIKEISLNQFELYLFGSRANDLKKGGDIDLLIITNDDEIKKLRANKTKLLAKIKMYLEYDERIDLTFISEKEKTTNSFFLAIPKEELILIFSSI